VKRKQKSWANCTFRELSQFHRDHIDVGDFSIMTDSTVVWLSEQKIGAPRKQHIELPRKTFNRLVAHYLQGRKPNRKAS
jgi:hypothetical protein